MRERLCSKIACAREAVATLTYDYGDQMAVLGPLGPEAVIHAHDLCSIHTERLAMPRGWVVVPCCGAARWVLMLRLCCCSLTALINAKCLRFVVAR